MPKNPNESLENRHTLYCGTSGTGKSQAMGQNSEFKKKGARIVFWDTHKGFKADHYNNITDLLKALKKTNNKKGGFKIAYSGEKSAESFEKLCRLVWAILDGNKITYFVIDELASVTNAIAKDRSQLGDLLRESRKFGCRIHLSATRAAEIPKTAFTQCNIKIIGAQGSVSDAKTMSDFLRIKPELLSDETLKPLHFYKKEPQKKAELIIFRYKKPPL